MKRWTMWVAGVAMVSWTERASASEAEPLFEEEAAAPAEVEPGRDTGPEEAGPDSFERRSAKNGIYADILGPGLFYSINYDRFLVKDVSARIGISYLSFGASASNGTTTSEAGFSYLAIPLTASYLGIGSDTHMLELGGGGVLMHVTGSGIVDSGTSSSSGSASATMFGATMLAGYRRQPAEGGFIFRGGVSPIFVFGDGFLPWGYISLGAAF